MRGDPLDGPDPEQPESWFREGGQLYEVGVYPSLMPIFMTQGSTGMGLTTLVAIWLFALAGKRRDPRWKVVVSSKPIKRATMFHAVQVEFAPSLDAAEERQREIVGRWVAGRFTDAVPMTSLELRRARRETRRGRPVPPARSLAGFSLTRLRARFCWVAGANLVAAGVVAIGIPGSARLAVTGYLCAACGLAALAAAAVLSTVDRVARTRTHGRRGAQR